MDATGLLHLIANEPTLLPAAPIGYTPHLIDNRRLHGNHPCLMCGQPSNSAIIAESPIHPEAGARWLDLCWPHYGDVKNACQLESEPVFGPSRFWND